MRKGLFLLLIVISVLLSSVIFTTSAIAAYSPIFPKTSSITSILVVDLSTDKSYQTWESKEALMAATAIQGIVNRTSSTKIYFINYPNEHEWNPPAIDSQQVETAGFFSVSHTHATLPAGKTYPALSYLLQNYGSYIKGKVLYPSLSGTVCDGAVMAAVTACGVEDAIPVSSAINTYVINDGYSFTQKADTRSLTTNIDAYNWAKSNYLSRTTQSFIGQHSYTAFGGGVNDQFPNVYDYFIASKAFVFSLNANNNPEKAKIQDLLGNYPQGIPIIGLPVDEGTGIDAMMEYGDYFAICNVQNLSCTSAFASNPATLPAPPAPTAATVADDGAYVAFYVTDGDSMAFSTYFHYDEQFNKSYPGQVPVGWSTSPLLMDLYPSLINKLWNYAPDYYEYVANWGDMNDINVLSGTGGWNKWTTDYKNYYDAMGFYTTNTFSRSNKYLDANQPYFNMIYYRYASPFTKYGPTVISGTSKLGDVESNVREQIDGYPAGQPAFALVCLGNGRDFNNEVYNRNINQRIKTAMDALNANPEGRTYHFLKPKDLAATYNAYYPQRVINAYTGDDNSGKIEAESYSSQSGTQLENCIEGGQDIAYIDNGDYLKFNDVDFGSGAAVFSARVASNNSNGGYLEVRLDSLTATPVATLLVSSTGGWSNYNTQTCSIASGATGMHTVYLKFVTHGTPTGLFNLNWFKFTPNTSAYNRIEAESYTSQSGTQLENCIEGGQNLAYIDDGDYTVYNDVDFGSGPTYFDARVASNNSNGGYIEVRLDSLTGTLVASLLVANTGGWSDYNTQTCSVSQGVTGRHNVYLKFVTHGTPSGLFNLNWFDFRTGVSYANGLDKVMASSYASQSGTQLENCIEGGQDVSYIDNGDYTAYNLNLGGGPVTFNARVASAGNGGNIEIRLDSPTGTLAGTAIVHGTGGWQNWTTVTCNVSGITGYHTIYLKFTGNGNGLFNLYWFRFNSASSIYNLKAAGSYSSQYGTQLENCTEGGQNVSYIDNGDYTVYNNMDFGSTGPASFDARVASANTGGNIEIRLDSLTGTLIGTCTVSGTGGWQTWTTVSCSVSGATGSHNLYLKFTGGTGGLFNFEWFKFN